MLTLRVLGPAVPQPPAQALDLLDDHRLRRRALRIVGRQSVSSLRQVLQPHGDMEPVQDWQPIDASVEKNAPQSGTAVGERRQRRALGASDSVEAAADQRSEVRVGLGDGAEDLPSSGRRLDIADPDLQVPLAVLAAPDEGRIQGHHDRLGTGRRRLRLRPHRQRLGDLEGVAAQGLGIHAGVHREHLCHHLGRRPVGHQRGELRPQPIQLRRRADVRRPSHARLDCVASGAAETGQPDRDLPEQRGDCVLAVVLHPAHITAAGARRTTQGVEPGLRGDDLPLDAGQQLLALGQAQTQGAQIGKGVGLGDPHDIGAVFFALSPDADQLHDPGHVASTSAGIQA